MGDLQWRNAHSKFHESRSADAHVQIEDIMVKYLLSSVRKKSIDNYMYNSVRELFDNSIISGQSCNYTTAETLTERLVCIVI